LINFGHIQLRDVIDVSQFEFDEPEQCYQQVSGMDLYYTAKNSSILQAHGSNLPSFIYPIRGSLPGHSGSNAAGVYALSSICINPGQTIPLHKDKHFLLRSRYKDMDTTTTRYLVFLQDWKSGHYFEIGEHVPYTQWKAGDWISFGQEDWHLAGNMGTDPFYTMQMTVFDE
jgi:hypothetical protein